jgi:hypothetical protein
LIKEKLKEFDAESEMAQKITGKQMKIRHGRGKKRKQTVEDCTSLLVKG